jgi:hypothetical protein
MRMTKQAMSYAWPIGGSRKHIALTRSVLEGRSKIPKHAELPQKDGSREIAVE